MKKVAVFVLVVVVLFAPIQSAMAIIDTERMLATGRYTQSSGKNASIIQNSSAPLGECVGGDFSAFISYGVLNGGTEDTTGIPAVSLMFFFDPGEMQDVTEFYWMYAQENGEMAGYGYTTDPISSSQEATTSSGIENTGVWDVCVYIFFIGNQLHDVQKKQIANNKPLLVVRTADQEIVYFEITEKAFNLMEEFYSDCANAGGFSEEEFRIVDYFHPLIPMQ